MLIQTQNDLHVSAPKTYLSFPEEAGTTVLRWKNPAGFNASWAIQIGELGEAQTEIVLLSSSTPAGTAGTITANTLYPHATDTPIYGIKYNQVVFEKSATGTSGVAAPITGGTITYQANSPYTMFDDTTAAVTDAWKTYYRNSALAVNTSESDWITSTGRSFYSLAKIRERVREKLWSDKFVSDNMINNWINEWQEKMRNTAIAVNQDYALGTCEVAFGTAGFGTITSTDFKQPRRIEVSFGGDKYLALKMGINAYPPGQIFNSTNPYFYMKGENVFGIKPDSTAGTAYITYYALGSVLSNDTDELPTSMKGYTQSFVNYCLSQAKYKENMPEVGNALYNGCQADLDKFKTEISPRNKTGNTYITLMEPISADEYWT